MSAVQLYGDIEKECGYGLLLVLVLVTLLTS